MSARVNGAGPTGALAALALAGAGWRVQLFDPLPRQRLLGIQRAYAFTHSSRRLLQRLGLWEALAPELSGFSQLHLVDGGLGRSVGFRSTDLGPLAAAVGWIGSHGPLMTLLLERLEANPAVAVVLGERSCPPAPPGQGGGLRFGGGSGWGRFPHPPSTGDWPMAPFLCPGLFDGPGGPAGGCG